MTNLREATNKTDQGYRFVDRDPVIEDLLYCMESSGLRESEIAAAAMCTWQTVHNVRVKTRRPQNLTVDRIMRACGFRRVLVTSAGRVVRR